MSLLALAVNEQFKHKRYFQIKPYGPDGKAETSLGFFEAAMTMNPKPQTVAIMGADAEYGISMMEGARGHAKRLGLKIVYDRPYPPNSVNFTSIVRAVQATNPDIVFSAGYPPDSAGLVRAALELPLRTKIFGGGMAAWQFAALKKQFGEQLNGLVNYELYVPEPTMNFPGIKDFIKQYREAAGPAAVDPLGHYVPPFVYAGMQVVEQAVEATKSTDDGKLAEYCHATTFKTVVGDIKFGADGEWEKGRIIMTQFQNVKGNDLEQFDKPGVQVVLYPPQFKSGDLIYPYPPSRK
jgi:branched-chain amino acid transport system substrate-binding protein